MPPRRAFVHVAATAAFVAITATWVRGILLHPASLLPGVAGDNMVFVWNMWWARFALSHEGMSLLRTPLLLFPFGADLTLHTNTLLASVFGAPIADPVVAQNIMIFVNLLLNFVCAYALAFRQTSDWRAAIFAALVFGWAPFLSAHLAGHFNLLGTWVLPLCALAAVRLRAVRGTVGSAQLGICLAIAAYMDYYLAIYAIVLSVCVLTAGRVSFTKPARAWRAVKPITVVLLVLLAIDTVVLLWVLTTSGGTVSLLGVKASVRGTENPAAIAWIVLLAVALLTASSYARPVWHLDVLRAAVPPMLVSSAVFVLAIMPLFWHGIGLWWSGDYVTQRYMWRSAPPGIDITTLVLGNPFSQLYGSAAARWYQQLGVGLVENVGWISPTALFFAAVGLYTSKDGAARVWIAALILFGLWCLGPYVYVAGHATTLWLPAVLLRWIPIINNARIPARAIVVVYLVLAVLGAHGLSHMLRSRRHLLLAWVLVALTVADLIPAAPAVAAVERPSIYSTLKAQPPGAVCELPFGLRDGFGEIGQLDPRSMFFQTIHEHALVGGFVARLPRDVAERYAALPIVGALLQLSAGGPLPAVMPTQEQAAEILNRLGIRFIVLSRTAPPNLKMYVAQVLPLRSIASDDERTLYMVDRSGF
jgi:hypothetical protein